MSWLLAFFVAITPLYVVRFAPVIAGVRIPTTLLELAFFVVCGVWVYTKWKSGKVERWKSEDVKKWVGPIGLFVAGSLLGILVAKDTTAAFGLWRAYILEPLVLFVIAKDVLRTERDKNRLVIGFSVALCWVGLTAIYQKITGYGIPAVWQPEDVRRVTSVFGFPNGVGLFCAPLVMIVLAKVVSIIESTKISLREKIVALPYFASAVLGVIACVFAESEGAIFGIVAGVAILGLCFKRLRIITLSGIIVGCLLVMFWPPLRDHVSIAVSLRDHGGYIRAFIWKDSLNMIMAHPFLGAGLGNYPEAFAVLRTRPWIEIFQYPHNIILNFWSELGLIGLSGFVWIVWQTLMRALMAIRGLAEKTPIWIGAGVVSALVAIIVHGLVDVPYFKNDLAMLFWMIVALVV